MNPLMQVRGGRMACALPLGLMAIVALLNFPAYTQPFWPQFRGPNGNGVAISGSPPVSFSKSNALWATSVPPGHSSPCVYGDRIYLTTFDEGKLDCRSYDRKSGALLWAKPVEVPEVEKTHPFNNPAAPTPAAQDDRVVYYFGSYGLVCYSRDGLLLWEKKLPPQKSRGSYGSATSPVVHQGLLILTLDTAEGGSRLLALKQETGETAWETPRPLSTAGWSTPSIWTREDHSEILVLGSKVLRAYNAMTGKELWSVDGFPIETAPSIAFNNNLVFACSTAIGGRSGPQFEGVRYSELVGFDQNGDGKIQFQEVPENFRFIQRPELPEEHPGRLLPFEPRQMLSGMDKDADEAVSETEFLDSMSAFAKMDRPILRAIRPGVLAKSEEARVAWDYSRNIPEIPSPLCYQGKVFMVRDGGLISCLNAESGSPLYSQRLGVSGGYTASPIAADGRVYLASHSGTIIVVDAQSDTLKVLAKNALGEKITATPAIAENILYIRTAKHLLAFSGMP